MLIELSITKDKPINSPKKIMKRHLNPLLAILLTCASALAQQKTVNIVTVNNPDMITLKKLAHEIRSGQPGYQTELAGA